MRAVGGLLEKEGYEVRVLDLVNMEKSHCYNPFVYLRDDNDVQRLATNLFKSTTPKYDILKHPNVKFTEDGGAEPFIHGTVSGDIADIAIEAIWDMDKDEPVEAVPASGYEILSEEDILESIIKEENEHEKKRDRIT